MKSSGFSCSGSFCGTDSGLFPRPGTVQTWVPEKGLSCLSVPSAIRCSGAREADRGVDKGTVGCVMSTKAIRYAGCMPTIQFDVLVPDDAAGKQVEEAFSRAVEILVRHERLTSGSVERDKDPNVHEDMVAQFRRAFEEERGEEPGDAIVQRYLISAEGASSVNQLAMGLSRVLTPKAELPNDPVALERQMDFELPAVYPWAVEVLR